MYPEPTVCLEHEENITDQVPALKATMIQLYCLLGAMISQPSPSEITDALPVRDALLSQLKLSTNIEKREKQNTTKQETQPRMDIASKDSELLLKWSQEVFSPQ